MLDSTATDSQVVGAITNAIGFIEHGDSDKAIDELRFAQDVILEAMMRKKTAIDQAVTERLRIRGGGDERVELSALMAESLERQDRGVGVVWSPSTAADGRPSSIYARGGMSLYPADVEIQSLSDAQSRVG